MEAWVANEQTAYAASPFQSEHPLKFAVFAPPTAGRLSKAHKEKEAEQRNGTKCESDHRTSEDKKEEKERKRKHPPGAER